MKYSIIFIAFLVINFSCKKKDSVTPAEKPLANASFDHSNYGIYKGVFVGSSGNAVINVNNDNTLNAVLKIDGTTSTYTSTQTIAQNQVSTINFISGSNSFTFSTSATGGNPAFSNIIIAGHPFAGMSVLKEKSDSLVKCYEGTFSGGSTGTFNMEINANVMSGAYNEVGASNLPPKMFGTITNNHLSASAPGDPLVQLPQCSYAGTTITGTIAADGQTISGTYSNCYGSGTWTGTRTK
ncbi:MAG: hypothetical protein ABIT05_14035 [Chitinophagaceae bacterium]